MKEMKRRKDTGYQWGKEWYEKREGIMPDSDSGDFPYDSGAADSYGRG